MAESTIYVFYSSIPNTEVSRAEATPMGYGTAVEGVCADVSFDQVGISNVRQSRDTQAL